MRLAAGFYDTLLVAASLCIATAALLPFTGGEAVPPGTLVYDVYLLAVAFGYFAWCWTRTGQTLGLRTWRLRVRRADGGPLSWRDATVRFAAAALSLGALGAGFLWILIDGERRSWHDRLSGTVVERVESGAITRPDA